MAHVIAEQDDVPLIREIEDAEMYLVGVDDVQLDPDVKDDAQLADHIGRRDRYRVAAASAAIDVVAIARRRLDEAGDHADSDPEDLAASDPEDLATSIAAEYFQGATDLEGDAFEKLRAIVITQRLCLCRRDV